MPESPPSGVAVDWDGDVATVTVRGALDHTTGVQIRDRLGVAPGGTGPARLVLDLTGVSDQLGAESLALIAVVKFGLPPGCAFEVRSPVPAVHDIMDLAATVRDPGRGEDAAEDARQDALRGPSGGIAV